MPHVRLDDYTTVQGLAKIVRIPTPRAHRLVRFLNLPRHKIGSHILIRKDLAPRVKKAVDNNEFPPGRKGKKEKKRALALRAGSKHRSVTTQ